MTAFFALPVALIILAIMAISADSVIQDYKNPVALVLLALMWLFFVNW